MLSLLSGNISHVQDSDFKTLSVCITSSHPFTSIAQLTGLIIQGRTKEGLQLFVCKIIQ